MNAVIREALECEGPVAANETMIEASLVSLREGLGEVRTELRELRADNKAIREKLEQKTDAIYQSHLTLSSKIEAVNASLTARMDGANASLTTKMDQGFASCNSKIDGVNASLTAKIDGVSASLTTKFEALTEGIAGLRSMQKAMLWVFGVVGSLVAIAGTLLTIGKTLRWF